MPIQRLNHAVLWVRDLQASARFYCDVLGLRARAEIPGRALFLAAPDTTNDHDLGLFALGPGAGPTEAGTRTVGLYHLAWEVDTLEELARLRGALDAAGALVGFSDHTVSKSLYAKDPDGIELEVAWMVPAALVAGESGAGVAPLDLDAEIARYGPRTLTRSLTEA